MSSLENISTEAIQCLAFADSYTKKSGKLILNFNELMMHLEERKRQKQHVVTVPACLKKQKNINM
jgi:hypothetical protein